MTLPDLRLKSSYNSAKINIIDFFYNPILSEAINYDRISGYFDSKSLTVASRGIYNFIKNKGHMRLLCGVQLDSEDLKTILNAEDLKNKINEKFLESLNNIEEIQKYHIQLLGWMIANDYLEIKVGVKIYNDSYLGGILHSKTGIIYDKSNNYLTFNGSNNETASGWENNIETFKVFLSWDNSKKYADDDIKDFEDFWENKIPNVKVMDIPEASKLGLINLAPENEEEMQKIIQKLKHLDNDERELFKHQEEAIKSWFKNDKKGIFEMATGTGKTFTAIKCLEQLLDENEDILTVITCPFTHLVEQWAKDVENLGLGIVYRYYGTGNSNWRKEFDKLNFNIKLGIINKPIIILTTHTTFSMFDFINKINECDKELFLIADEMHHLGAEKYSEGLLPKYKYKLGLSATPSKYMDPEGTENLINYFGGIVYKFGILEALTAINPETNKSYLTPYDYYPRKVDLNDEELKEYRELSKKIGYKINSKKNEDNDDSLNSLLFKRRAVVNNAEEKYDILIDILREMNHPDHLIIFCSDKQIEKVMEILDKEGVIPRHQFTHHENLEERKLLIDEFDKGKYKVLVAMKCLNEGVDVPSADKVIIMSSTTNPIEYVQRRGRVLRRYKDKDKAYIYDLIVIPETNDSIVKKIIENELTRLHDFIETASNAGDCIKILEKWGVLGEN